MTGVAEEIAARDIASVSSAMILASPDDLVDALCGLVTYGTGPGRGLTTARLVLFVEASHDPALRHILDRGRAALVSMALMALAGLGATAPEVAAQAIMSCAEGLTLHRIARHDNTDPRPALALVVHAALS